MLYRSNAEAAAQCLELLPGAGHLLRRCDVADPVQVQEAVAFMEGELGGVDILVNNAGIGAYHSVQSSSYAQWQDAWRETLATNLMGAANLSFCAAQLMRRDGGGRIVNISSRGAFRGEPIKPAYGASKAALNSLTQSLAVALAADGIFVAAVAPGFINTALTADRLASAEGDAIRAQSPLNRVAEPEEVAYAAMFLASSGAEFSTGTILDVNGASYLRS
jgi:NAD(P)-dependent dehydrogenase (short-subunit alcohol dehydrogenase family)